MAKKNDGKATKTLAAKKKFVRTGIAKAVIVLSGEPELEVGDSGTIVLASNFIFSSSARPRIDSITPAGYTVDIAVDSVFLALMTLRLTLTGIPTTAAGTVTEIVVTITILDGTSTVPVAPIPVLVLD